MRKAKAIESFLLHLHPHKVSSSSIAFTRTFGLGGINVLLFLILAITGILLRFSYVPTATEAYSSIIYLQNEVLFGQWIRNIHHFAAHLILITSFLHLLRVYYSHSLYGQRAKNWLYGLCLFVFVLMFNFTGYLLPWDQLSYWAVTVVTGLFEHIPFVGQPIACALRGSDVVDATTLLNFYTIHTGLLPLLFFVFMTIHFWLVRKAGGVTKSKKDIEMCDSHQKLVPKEILMAVAILAVILVFSALVNAPLKVQANPAITPNPNKAPWYFLGVQELLLHVNPGFVFIVGLLITGFFIGLPYCNKKETNIGVWFYSKRGKRLTIYTIILTIVYTFALILSLEYVTPDNNIFYCLSGDFLRVLIYVLPFIGFVFYQHKKEKLHIVEVVQIGVTAVLISYFVMLLVALLFRGEGMMLF